MSRAIVLLLLVPGLTIAMEQTEQLSISTSTLMRFMPKRKTLMFADKGKVSIKEKTADFLRYVEEHKDQWPEDIHQQIVQLVVSDMLEPYITGKEPLYMPLPDSFSVAPYDIRTIYMDSDSKQLYIGATKEKGNSPLESYLFIYDIPSRNVQQVNLNGKKPELMTMKNGKLLIEDSSIGQTRKASVGLAFDTQTRKLSQNTDITDFFFYYKPRRTYAVKPEISKGSRLQQGTLRCERSNFPLLLQDVKDKTLMNLSHNEISDMAKIQEDASSYNRIYVTNDDQILTMEPSIQYGAIKNFDRKGDLFTLAVICHGKPEE